MLYVLIYTYKKNIIYVDRVIAGSTSINHSDANVIITPFENFYSNNKKVKLKDYIIKWVDGICMTPKNINDKDIVFIQRFENNKQKLETIKKGDVLYIEYNKCDNEVIPKIREFLEFDKLGESAKTFYYLNDGQIQESKFLHKIDDVKGVVKMVFSR
jgi:hypothetical protein